MFFGAGFETAASTMSFCLYELAVNPDIQDRLKNEIDTVLEKHGGSVTYEGIQDMKYLDKIISGKDFRIVQNKTFNVQIKFPEPKRCSVHLNLLKWILYIFKLFLLIKQTWGTNFSN